MMVGSFIIFLVGSLMGSIGARTGFNSYLLVRLAFGDSGARLVNLAFSVSLLGWFGINLNLFGLAETDAGEQAVAEAAPFFRVALQPALPHVGIDRAGRATLKERALAIVVRFAKAALL